MRMLGTFVVGAALLSASALACINDRDTLAFEKRNVDALNRVSSASNEDARAEAISEIALRAIGGRFDRFPPRYYEMRIARLEKQPTLTATEYDDLAVAYERLGQTDKALEILKQSLPFRKTKDDEYRLLANRGTFLVHKWIAGGHSKANIDVLARANQDIDRAIKVNPGSHFGREKYQLKLQTAWYDAALGNPNAKDHLKQDDEGEAVVAYAGIVMMGLGYELPDVYALMTPEYMRGGAQVTMLNELPALRAKDLVKQGKAYIYPKLASETITFPADATAAYQKLREDGEKVYQDRLAYMNVRLDRGEHPDTHPDFWKEWEEPPAAYLKRDLDGHLEGKGRENQITLVAIIAFLLGAIALLITLARKLLRKLKVSR
jgi:tetratricopeptide (TPR) repeat protein